MRLAEQCEKQPRFIVNRGILRGLWNKLEYVPNRITIIRGDPTFSGINFASLGWPVLYHLSPDAACLAGGQVTIVAALQVDADLPYILNSSGKEAPAEFWLPGVNSLTGSVTISPMNL